MSNLSSIQFGDEDHEVPPSISDYYRAKVDLGVANRRLRRGMSNLSSIQFGDDRIQQPCESVGQLMMRKTAEARVVRSTGVAPAPSLPGLVDAGAADIQRLRTQHEYQMALHEVGLAGGVGK